MMAGQNDGITGEEQHGAGQRGRDIGGVLVPELHAKEGHLWWRLLATPGTCASRPGRAVPARARSSPARRRRAPARCIDTQEGAWPGGAPATLLACYASRPGNFLRSYSDTFASLAEGARLSVAAPGPRRCRRASAARRCVSVCSSPATLALRILVSVHARRALPLTIVPA